jgi:predicted DCC family thiol-disulfide oxidoreductase YuxK
MAETLVLYDEDCGICAALAERLMTRQIDVAPIGSSLGRHWLRDLSPTDRYAAFHAVDADGRRRSGGDAVPLVIDALDRRAIARLARAFPGVTGAAYRAVASRRGTLSRLVGTPACGDVRRASRGPAG